MKINMRFTKWFSITIGLLFAFLFLTLVISFINTIVSRELYHREFCFESSCIEYLGREIAGVISLGQAFGWFITLITALGGALIALHTYVSGVNNSNVTNHIAHFSMFRDFVNSEIAKRKKIYPDTVDVYFWYNTIFPNSKSGDLNFSSDYVLILENIKSIVDEANDNIALLSGKYKYQVHQRKIKDICSRIGVSVSSGPKNIYIDIELELFGLIDSVNTTFIGNFPVLCSIQRKYC
ncbi:hypothetical protein H1224_06995 [Pectobacterium aroidearum]|uniref:retron Ec48 family effector membrane protein n=1 Tax=Pectobacterium aroidearum TaxID=1201031 RepID=UPI0015F3B50F|nr:retron Ec48 family effector membrane protein [Pectobacterium aroidearum]MBA5600808.1 hypothetical protein [Pectobacterium aroidearum]